MILWLYRIYKSDQTQSNRDAHVHLYKYISLVHMYLLSVHCQYYGGMMNTKEGYTHTQDKRIQLLEN